MGNHTAMVAAARSRNARGTSAAEHRAASDRRKQASEVLDLKREAKALKGQAPLTPIVVAPQDGAPPHDATDPREAWQRADGSHLDMMEYLVRQPDATLHAMIAHPNFQVKGRGPTLPKSADRLEMARYIALHMAPRANVTHRSTVDNERDLVRLEIRLRQEAARAAPPATRQKTSSKRGGGSTQRATPARSGREPREMAQMRGHIAALTSSHDPVVRGRYARIHLADLPVASLREMARSVAAQHPESRPTSYLKRVDLIDYLSTTGLL